MRESYHSAWEAYRDGGISPTWLQTLMSCAGSQIFGMPQQKQNHPLEADELWWFTQK